MELIKTFSPEQYGQALESWSWLGLDGKTPVFSSLFGDVFFQSANGFWFLDIVEGTVTRTWVTGDEMRSGLRSAEGQATYLLAGLAEAAAGLHGVLDAPQVYDFKIPPVLGGQVDVANLAKMDFVVSVDIAGQLHQQVKDLPPETRISRFSLGSSDS